MLGPTSTFPNTQELEEHPVRGHRSVIRPGDGDPYGSCGDPVEREPPEAIGVLLEGPVRALQPDNRIPGRDELADQSPRVRIGDHHLDLQAGRLERQLARPAVVAYTGELRRRVEHEISKLLVNRPPGERSPGGGGNVVGYGIGLLQGAPEQFVQGLIRKIGWVTTVVTHHPPAFGSMSAGSSRRSLSRHLALVGPMLPIERPRISAIVW